MSCPDTVSIIIPTFNRRDLLAESLQSVLAQTYRPLEVIVVDDGSTDGTPEIRENWVEQGRLQGVDVVWIRQENQGVSVARNRGLEVCTGDFILFHDSDDLLDPRKVERQVAKLKETGADMCAASRHEFLSQSREVIGRYTPAAKCSDALTPVEVKTMHWGAPMFMYCRSVLAGMRWDESLRSSVDIEFNFRVLQQDCHVCLAPDAITLVREHEDGQRLTRTAQSLQRYWEVHRRMLRFYREKKMDEHLAIEQRRQLGMVAKLFQGGDKQEARRYFAEMQPFAPSVVAGGIGERLALKLRCCTLFCHVRNLNLHLGEWHRRRAGRASHARS